MGAGWDRSGAKNINRADIKGEADVVSAHCDTKVHKHTTDP